MFEAEETGKPISQEELHKRINEKLVSEQYKTREDIDRLPNCIFCKDVGMCMRCDRGRELIERDRERRKFS